jgi:hypothetical protein
VSSFIGRARELEQTAAPLGQARVVTLTGPGGVGKTRLALQAAAQVAPRFGDGAWLCELAPIREPAGVDDAVAAVFSVTARAGQSTRQTHRIWMTRVVISIKPTLAPNGGSTRGLLGQASAPLCPLCPRRCAVFELEQRPGLRSWSPDAASRHPAYLA